jgi:3-phenylpropionate/cinnamic acid dioxygenase small subunit
MSAPVAPELQQAIEQFLYSEANLLDERRFDEWFALFADDIRYWMPVRFNRMRKDRAHEFSKENEVALFDEDKRSLEIRVKRLATGRAWAEEPPSRTRHIVSNVRITPSDATAEFTVQCNFFLYRSRGERQVDHFVGGRDDVLRRANNEYGFQVARRTIYLDQTMVLANNLSVFF